MNVIVPEGYGAYQGPYKEEFDGQRPSLSINGPSLPHPCLPIALLDEQHNNDPIALEMGTWVGMTNSVDHRDFYEKLTGSARRPYLMPACASTGEYTLTYSAYDLGKTADADDPAAAVAAAEATTVTVPPVKPLGITFTNGYGKWFGRGRYKRQSMLGFLSWGYAVWLPVRSAGEALIQRGDTVVIDEAEHAALTWSPLSATNAVGRMRKAVAGDDPSMIVGKCLDKVELATQGSGSANQTLKAGLIANNVSTTGLHNFGELKRVQTLPGLYLQGSGTQGIPAWFGAATAQSTKWYGLLISVRCN